MKTKKDLVNNIIGQLEAVNRMMEQKEPCEKVIVQMKAIRSAMSNVMEKYIEENISQCISGRGIKKSEDLKKLVSQLIRNK